MRPKKLFNKKRIVSFCILIIMGAFIIGSDVYLQSVRNGLRLYVVAVLPATFPFFFFSKMLTELNFANDLSKGTEKPLKFLFHAPPIAGYILVMSLLCGYPIGAKLLSEFYSLRFIDRKDAKKILSFTSTGGPIFIIGTVGVAMFGNKTYGIILLVSHYLGTFFNGLLYRGKKLYSSSASLPFLRHDDVLAKSMVESFLSVGVVGGFIVLFNLFIDMVENTDLFSPLIALLSYIKVPSRLSKAFLFGVVEMTRGCKMFSVLSYPPYILLPCCCFLITFGGLSVTFQSLAYLSKIKISPAYYLLTKCTQGTLSALITLIMSLVFF